MFSIRLIPPEQPIIRPHKKLSHEDLRANLFSTTAAVVAMTANSAAGSLEPEGCWDCWSSSPDCGAMPPPPPPPLKITEIFPFPAEPLPLGLLGLGLLLGLWGRYGVFSAGVAAEAAGDGEGTSEEEAASAPLLS
jgi:hypothetical protein